MLSLVGDSICKLGMDFGKSMCSCSAGFDAVLVGCWSFISMIMQLVCSKEWWFCCGLKLYSVNRSVLLIWYLMTEMIQARRSTGRLVTTKHVVVSAR